MEYKCDLIIQESTIELGFLEFKLTNKVVVGVEWVRKGQIGFTAQFLDPGFKRLRNLEITSFQFEVPFD